MSKQVNFTNGSLIVKTRLLEDYRARLSKVIVTCKGETGLVFYRYPEQYLNDPDYLSSVKMCGYTVNDLIIIAELLKEKGVNDYDLKNYTDGVKDGYAIAQAYLEKSLQETFNNIVSGITGEKLGVNGK